MRSLEGRRALRYRVVNETDSFIIYNVPVFDEIDFLEPLKKSLKNFSKHYTYFVNVLIRVGFCIIIDKKHAGTYFAESNTTVSDKKTFSIDCDEIRKNIKRVIKSKFSRSNALSAIVSNFEVKINF
jgi:hypothetical protein